MATTYTLTFTLANGELGERTGAQGSLPQVLNEILRDFATGQLRDNWGGLLYTGNILDNANAVVGTATLT